VLVHCSTLSDDSYQRIAACGCSVSVATESEQSAGQGYPSSWKLRQFDIPIALSHDTSVWWSADLFTAMRTTLGADRSRQHFEAQAKGETVTQLDVRSEHVVEWATRGGSKALGLDDKIGSIEVGKRADIVLIKNDESPVMFPIVNPFGHVAMQAQRADVHTVMIDGNIVKHEHRLINIDLAKARSAIEETVGFLADTLGEEAWNAGMHPDLPAKKEIENPYHYNK
jgi:cytosine/adenosine deaminase-related metal-dependent hydrolase